MEPTTMSPALVTLREWQLVAMFLINLVTIVGLMWKGMGIMLTIRDNLRDLTKAVGTTHPPEGILGDVTQLQTEIRQHDKAITELYAVYGRRVTDRELARQGRGGGT